jgi:hypothetical protein
MSKKQKIIFSLIFVVCFLFQILPVIRSGLNYDYGIGFWGSNGHDAIWHLSLINHIKNPLKINLPIFAGETLKNYHPFYDILISVLSNITHISSIFWYFQIFPIISTYFLLLTSFLLGRKLTSNFTSGLLLMFFNSFANSFGWIVSLIRSGQIYGESLFWSMQSVSNQLNPPFTLSLIFINLFLLLILNKKINLKIKNILLLIILILTPITKAYGGIVIYSIFAFYSLFSFKNNKKPFILLLISLPLSYLVFSLYNSASGSLFIFKPFWFVNSLIESPDRFYLPYLANMRYTLESAGRIGPRLIALYFFLVGVFYLGNFSWRLLGLFSLKTFKNSLKLPLFFTILITALIPLFLIQKGTSWNTIQFLYYSLFLSNIFLVIFFSKEKQSIFKKIILFIVLLTTLIASYETFTRYLSNPAPSSLPKAEIEALDFLKAQNKGIVLTFPYDKYKKVSFTKTPLPLYAYETTAYVSAFSNQVSFLEDEMNLEITGFDWQSRRQEVDKFFKSQDEYFTRGFLVNNKIDYIYLVNDQNFSIDTETLQVDNIFQNDQVKIYKVRR